MSCPKNNKNCQPVLIYECNKKNYICAGINKKPTAYKNDVIWLCLSGELSNRTIEMTAREASWISSVLTAAVGEISPAILKKQNATRKKKKTA